MGHAATRPRPADRRRPGRPAVGEPGLNVAITVAEVIGGLMAGSLALLSDAAHNLSDVVALGLAVGSRRLARRPPTPRHTYGLKRAEVIAALVNACRSSP